MSRFQAFIDIPILHEGIHNSILFTKENFEYFVFAFEKLRSSLPIFVGHNNFNLDYNSVESQAAVGWIDSLKSGKTSLGEEALLASFRIDKEVVIAFKEERLKFFSIEGILNGMLRGEDGIARFKDGFISGLALLGREFPADPKAIFALKNNPIFGEAAYVSLKRESQADSLNLLTSFSPDFLNSLEESEEKEIVNLKNKIASLEEVQKKSIELKEEIAKFKSSQREFSDFLPIFLTSFAKGAFTLAEGRECFNSFINNSENRVSLKNKIEEGVNSLSNPNIVPSKDNVFQEIQMKSQENKISFSQAVDEYFREYPEKQKDFLY